MDFFIGDEDEPLESVTGVPIPRVGEFVRINDNTRYKVEEIYYHYKSRVTFGTDDSCTVIVILSEVEE
jgi:hypothetical protein